MDAELLMMDLRRGASQSFAELEWLWQQVPSNHHPEAWSSIVSRRKQMTDVVVRSLEALGELEDGD